jgi:hypothetical protein
VKGIGHEKSGLGIRNKVEGDGGIDFGQGSAERSAKRLGWERAGGSSAVNGASYIAE